MHTLNRPLKVFLCHSSVDKATVRELYQKLKDEGWIDPWLDEEKLLPGEDWDIEIQKAVEITDAVIVCVSNKSVTKEGYVQKEIRMVLDVALEKPEDTIFIIPLRLDDCVLPRRLRTWQYVNYFPHLQKSSVYDRLIRSLKAQAEKIGIFDNQIGQKTEVEDLAKQAIQFELRRDYWNALQLYYKIKGIDSQFIDIDIKIRELQRELQPNVVHTVVKNKTGFGRLPYFGVISGFFAVTLLALIGWWIFYKLPVPGPAATPSLQPTLVPTSVATFVNPAPSETSVPETPTVIAPATGKDGMPLIYIPAGEFQMGSRGQSDEMPIHTVNLDAYWIDKTEVTNGMYAECVDSKACKEPRANTSITRYKEGNLYFRNPDYDHYPVIYVSWLDAKNYCEWVGRRLPTEAEWEKTASWNEQSQLSRKYPWGNAIDCSFANFRFDNNLCVGDTTPVGSYPTGGSYYGALDMAGNVWEWVFDRYDREFYNEDTIVTNPSGPLSGNYMVIRGGSFLTGREVGNRSADREMILPDSTSHNLGFRCAMDATP